MKMSELNPGDFFEFQQPERCFGKCMFVGKDEYDRLNFVHQSASLVRFILNEEIQGSDPNVKLIARGWEHAR